MHSSFLKAGRLTSPGVMLPGSQEAWVPFSWQLSTTNKCFVIAIIAGKSHMVLRRCVPSTTLVIP